MNEARAWESLREVLKALGLDPVRVENVAGGAEGTPDVNYTAGWIELKWIDSWPKRASTKVMLEKLAVEQTAWLERRWRAHGLSWLALHAEGEWHLYAGPEARAFRLGWWTRDEAIEQAWWRSRDGLGPHADPQAHQQRLKRILQGAVEEVDPHIRARFYRMFSNLPAVHVSEELGWTLNRLHCAERGSSDTNDLLDYWLT